jgi:hypothetical protein
VNAIQSSYDSETGLDGISVTQLDTPPKVRLLTHRHKDDIVIDAEGEGHALFGEAMHYVIEKAQDKTYIKGTRISKIIHDKILTGKFDLYDKFEARIEDYKTASVWTFIFNKDKWEKQLNCYQYLVKNVLKLHVSGLVAVVYFKDWYELESVKYDEYPPFNPYVFNVDMWDEQKQISYITERIDEHKKWEEKPDDEIPECTPKERFKQPDKWAVYKSGKEDASRAVRVWDSLQNAEQFVQSNPKGFTIVQRIGYDKRCHHYCKCRDFCHYWKKINDCGKCEL